MNGAVETKGLYLPDFQRLEKEISAKDAPWLKDLREKALHHFAETGFPSAKSEFWRYTDLTTSLLRVPLAFGSGSSVPGPVLPLLASLGFDPSQAHVLVFLNGRFSKELSNLKSLPAGVKLGSLAEALPGGGLEEHLNRILAFENRPFAALNTACFTDGLFLQVPAGKEIPEPIHAVYLSVNGNAPSAGATQSHPRNLLLLGEDSRAVVLEHYLGLGAGATLTNAVTEARLSRGASLEHDKIEQESGDGYHIGGFSALQQEGSRLVSRVFAVGGALGRSEVETSLSAKKAECLLEGLYLGKGKQHLDTRTFIDHLSPECKSEEVFKGVLDGEATGIFDGRVLVRENAQKTDARQSNKNLQLSNESKVYSRPQLHIYADDVKCTHGSATGQLDEEALFYLRSRGIDREEARRTLVRAFAGEMVDRVTNTYLKGAMEKMVNVWMGGPEARSK